MYGPSYVSLEWALSYYEMIPEKVFNVTSMTTGKVKEFQTSRSEEHTSELQSTDQLVCRLLLEKKKKK